MATITLKGNEIHTSGELPKVGEQAPNFNLTAGDLSEVSLSSYEGKKLVLNILPSLDTAVCQNSTKRFNESASGLEGTKVLVISADLPFAQKRFCGAENVIPLSEMRDRSFGQSYGVEITDGPLAGLTARAVVVLDANHKVVYNELVPEIAQEPNYDAALTAVKNA